MAPTPERIAAMERAMSVGIFAVSLSGWLIVVINMVVVGVARGSVPQVAIR